MLEHIKGKSACTGCSACVAACPVSCIRMECDSEGFWYPVSSDACIACKKCEKVCPVLHREKTESKHKQRAYAFLTKDQAIWQRSASGGAFSEICLAWGDAEAVVVGASWDGLRVHHECVIGVQNIERLCKSKYVASYPENTFKEVKMYLKENRKVIFCGTPCMVAGLKASLGRKYDNLLTIDIICHGVGSPKVFRESIKCMEKQLGKITRYEFRAKRKYHETDYLSKIEINGKPIYLREDPYIKLFLSQNCLRPSCGENCVFRTSSRQGDVTISDFRGLSVVFPELQGMTRNFSAIVTNSNKGDEVVSMLDKRAILKECRLDDIVAYNPLFARHTFSSMDRNVFFDDFEADASSAIEKWGGSVRISKFSMKKWILNTMPFKARRWLYKLYKFVCKKGKS